MGSAGEIEEGNFATKRSYTMNKNVTNDPLFQTADAIKADYLASGCQAADVDAAVESLMQKCGEIFQDDRAAWEFLMEETHEEM